MLMNYTAQDGTLKVLQTEIIKFKIYGVHIVCFGMVFIRSSTSLTIVPTASKDSN